MGEQANDASQRQWEKAICRARQAGAGDHGIAEAGKPRSAMNGATKSATLEPQQVTIPTRQEVP